MKELRLPLTTPVGLLVLIGGGEFSFGETRAIDEFLLSRMPRGNDTVAFLPTASGSAEYATHLGRYFQGIRPQVRTVNVPIYRGRDSRRQRNLNQILSAGMIYIGGGVAGQFLATVRESPAEMALREAAAGGAVIAAIGAAASSFGAWTGDAARGGAPLPALGWLGKAVLETGFAPDNDIPLRRLMSIPDVEIGVGVPPATALAIHPDGSTELVGEGSVAVVRKA